MKFEVGDTSVVVNMSGSAALLDEVGRRLTSGEGFAIATLNLDHLVKLGSSERFRSAYAAQDMVTADGNPIVWLSRLAGRDLSLAPGSDLVVPLARTAADVGAPVALVGSTEASLERAGQAMQRMVPGLSVVARIAPPMGFDADGPEAEALLDSLVFSGARLVFLALGAPRQEQLAARGRLLTPGLGFASIGAGLDFLAGHQRRAPRWVRALALEWLWRLGGNPRRLAGRYVRAASILPGHALRAWRSRV